MLSLKNCRITTTAGFLPGTFSGGGGGGGMGSIAMQISCNSYFSTVLDQILEERKSLRGAPLCKKARLAEESPRAVSERTVEHGIEDLFQMMKDHFVYDSS